MNRAKNSIVSVLISVVMKFTAVPLLPGTGEVHAAGEVGRLNVTSYSSFKDLTKALENNHKNRRVTIDVMCNWNAAGSDDFDRSIVIPEGCTAALSMHGYVINRNRAFLNNSDSDGEVICLEKGATLEIFGGYNEAEKKMAHPNVATYSSTRELVVSGFITRRRIMINNKKVAFGLFVVIFMVLWNLLDFIYSAFISKSPYQFSMETDLGLPLIVAIIMGYTLFLKNKNE